MGTILFDSIIFGPVKSRRLGNSLGINLLPVDSKLCNYNCIYCECGWTYEATRSKNRFHKMEDVLDLLEEKLALLQAEGNIPDSITFAGNGEPTLHPSFPAIVDGVISLRDNYFPEAKVAVLSNGTTVQKAKIFQSLLKVDRNMLKLDSAIEGTYQVLNMPPRSLTLARLIHNLKKFNGHFILQTMFLTGNLNGNWIDNTKENELQAWLDVVQELNPTEVHIYSIARETPSPGLKPVPAGKLEEISQRLKERSVNSFVFS